MSLSLKLVSSPPSLADAKKSSTADTLVSDHVRPQRVRLCRPSQRLRLGHECTPTRGPDTFLAVMLPASGSVRGMTHRQTCRVWSDAPEGKSVHRSTAVTALTAVQMDERQPSLPDLTLLSSDTARSPLLGLDWTACADHSALDPDHSAVGEYFRRLDQHQ